MQSLQIAQLKNLVSELPNGLSNDVGEHGMMLSGGERQRIALARSFYHEREIIIMDEATAALDYDTEKQLVEAINEFGGVITSSPGPTLIANKPSNKASVPLFSATT